MDGRPVKRRRYSLREIGAGKVYTSSFNDGSSEPATQHKPSPVGDFGIAKSSHKDFSRLSENAADISSDGSHHSSLLKLKIDELLRKIKARFEIRSNEVDNALHELQDAIDGIPDRDGLPIAEAQRALEQSTTIRIPFPMSPANSSPNLLLAYSKPAALSVAGTFSPKTALLLDGTLTIDLAVTMPSQIFQSKDYRDYRYFQKRAYFLACLADGIQKASVSSFDLAFAYQDDNPLQPILIVKPYQGGTSIRQKYQIRIILAADAGLFPVDKTLPNKRCTGHSMPDEQNPSQLPAYNATLRSECCFSLSLEQLHQSMVQSSAFRDACMLGTVWLRQRGFDSSMTKGGFGQLEWSSMVSMLMRGGGSTSRPVLANAYSSYQIFKGTLQYLATTDFSSSPMLLHSTKFQLAADGTPVFFDGSRGLNLLFKMSPWSYQILRHEASSSLKALKDPLADHFKSLFISRVDEPLKQFDSIFRIPFDVRNSVVSGADSIQHQLVDFAHRIYDKFTYGLGDRVYTIQPKVPALSPWQTSSPRPSLQGFSYVAVGLLLNPGNSRRTVDRGPPIEDKKASALFRNFWGDKAELRRFKDGTILESVIWNQPNSKGTVVDRIVTYILQHHFGINEPSGIESAGEAFDNLLPQHRRVEQDILGPFSTVRGAFESLCKSIRALDGLPLQIRQIAAASPELRFSSLYAPDADRPESLRGPVEFQVQFEGSARWPPDLVAVQRTKIAFLLKISEGLSQDELVSITSLGLDSGKYELPEEPFLDIGTVDGITFRIRIYHEQSLSLLEQALHGQTRFAASREGIALAISDWKRRFVQAPAHTQAVYSLSTRFPLLSLTIRLFKKWRDAHLLSSHIRDELIELLVIRTFVHPYPWQPPGSLTSAFVRTLAFVASWSWQSDPLIIDFSSELIKQDIEAINVRFEAWRKLDPSMNRIAMFAASNLDREGITWTDRRPTKLIAARFTNLAKAASKLAAEKGPDLEPEVLFVPSLAEYDFIIHLKPEYGIGNKKKSTYKNLQVDPRTDPLNAIFNPSQQFFDELEDLYSDSIIFFYNSSSTTVIAGLWNPQTGPRDWKINLDYSTVPLADSQGAINKASTLHDIARLGGDMVARIDQKS